MYGIHNTTNLSLNELYTFYGQPLAATALAIGLGGLCLVRYLQRTVGDAPVPLKDRVTHNPVEKNQGDSKQLEQLLLDNNISKKIEFQHSNGEMPFSSIRLHVGDLEIPYYLDGLGSSYVSGVKDFSELIACVEAFQKRETGSITPEMSSAIYRALFEAEGVSDKFKTKLIQQLDSNDKMLPSDRHYYLQRFPTSVNQIRDILTIAKRWQCSDMVAMYAIINHFSSGILKDISSISKYIEALKSIGEKDTKHLEWIVLKILGELEIYKEDFIENVVEKVVASNHPERALFIATLKSKI